MFDYIDKTTAAEILNHLESTDQAFCFIDGGVIINREDCQEIINH